MKKQTSNRKYFWYSIATIFIGAVLIAIVNWPHSNSNATPQYVFGDQVRMTRFYRCCSGTVVNFLAPNHYLIDLSCMVDDLTYNFQSWVDYADIAEVTKPASGVELPN